MFDYRVDYSRANSGYGVWIMRRVKVVSINKDEINRDFDADDHRHIGNCGTVVKEGNGSSVETMIIVNMDNDGPNAFWPEELETI